MDLQHFFRSDLAKLSPYSVKKNQPRIKLDANESPFDLPTSIRQEIQEKLSKLRFHLYPEPTADELRQSLSTYLGLPTDWIVVGNGSDELLSYLVQAFSREHSAVLYPTPTFSMYGILAQIAGISAFGIPLDDNFDLDAEIWQRQLNQKKQNLVFFSYPNNPTGNLFNTKVIDQILERPNTLVVLDEAYYEFSGRTFLDKISSNKNLIITRTFSKAYGLASLRCGYLIAHPDIINQVNKIRLPYNLNQFTQVCISSMLKQREMITSKIALLQHERGIVYEALKNMEGVYPFPTNANFILFRTQSSSSRVHASLLDKGVLIRSFEQKKPLINCLRVTVGTDKQNRQFLSNLAITLSQD